MQAVTEAVSLCVGSTQFHTTRDTLCKSPYFEALLEDIASASGGGVPGNQPRPAEGANMQDDKGVLFHIDRDAKAFKHVLSLLRDPGYPFPFKFRHELGFYGLTHEPSTAAGPYLLPSDLMSFPDRGKAGPVQLVPVHQALPLVDFDKDYIAVEFTKETEAPLRECHGAFFYGDSLRVLLNCEQHMPIYVETTPTHFTCIGMNDLPKYMRGFNQWPARVVPVVTSLAKPLCTALLINPRCTFQRFKTLPRGATLE
jgi:hypothetical protein